MTGVDSVHVSLAGSAATRHAEVYGVIALNRRCKNLAMASNPLPFCTFST